MFADLSVAENLALGHGYETAKLGTVRWSRLYRRAAELIERFEIDASPRTPLRSLSQSNRTLVAIARALQTGSHEQGLLDPRRADLVASCARGRAAARPSSPLRGSRPGDRLCDHRLDEVLSLTDRVTVLRDGRVVANAETDALTESDLIRMIVGGDIDRLLVHEAPARTPDEKPVLELRKVEHRAAARHRPRCPAGRDRRHRRSARLGSQLGAQDRLRFDGSRHPASVLVGGEEVAFSHVRQAIDAGVAYVPENRAEDAAFPDLPIYANITMARIRAYWGRWRMRHARMRSDARGLIDDFLVKASVGAGAVRDAIGRQPAEGRRGSLAAHRPALLLLDEPTQGVDVQARAEIYGAGPRAAEAGTSVVVVASDFEELAHVVDRAIVIRDGSVVGALAQLVALAREDERRIGLELRDHIAQSLLVRPVRLLRRGQVSPGVSTGVGFSVHGHRPNITGYPRGVLAPPGL